MNRLLDPKNDIAFKRIFGSEKNKDILIGFLNDVIVFREGGPVVDVTFLKPAQDPEIANLKSSIVDILCHDDRGRQYIVEMQVAYDSSFLKRAQYYAAKAYVGQMHTAYQYHTLREIVFLSITNFTMFPQKQAFKSDHITLDKVTGEHDLKDFSFTFLELPKFTKPLTELTTHMDKWMYFLKNTEEPDPQHLVDHFGDTPVLLRAYEELDRFYWTPDELRDYDSVQDKISVYNGTIRTSYEMGLQKGEEKGREEGRREEKLANARTLLARGLDITFVKDALNLTEDEVRTLCAAV